VRAERQTCDRSVARRVERAAAALHGRGSGAMTSDSRAQRGEGGGLRCRRGRRGVALLEVVVSISILLVAMAVIGLAFRNGQYNLQRSERITRAMLLTERLLAELDTGYLEIEEREQSGWFDVEAEEGMSWFVEINPDDNIDGLLKVDITIFLGDPEGTDEEHVRILSTHVFRPEPMGIDFERDFGLDEDQITQLTDAIPGGEAVIDPTDFDPRDLARLDLDTLVEILPALMEALGVNLGAGQLNQILGGSGGADLSGLQNLAPAGGGASGRGGGPSGLPAGGGVGDLGAGDQGGRRGGPDNAGLGRRGSGGRRGGGRS